MGHGKFDSELTEHLYGISLDGGPDEETGDSSYGQLWAGIMRGGRQLAQAIADENPNVPGLDELADAAGVILFEDSQGFVSSAVVQDGDRLEDEWESVVEESGYEENHSARTWIAMVGRFETAVPIWLDSFDTEEDALHSLVHHLEVKHKLSSRQIDEVTTALEDYSHYDLPGRETYAALGERKYFQAEIEALERGRGVRRHLPASPRRTTRSFERNARRR